MLNTASEFIDVMYIGDGYYIHSYAGRPLHLSHLYGTRIFDKVYLGDGYYVHLHILSRTEFEALIFVKTGSMDIMPFGGQHDLRCCHPNYRMTETIQIFHTIRSMPQPQECIEVRTQVRLDCPRCGNSVLTRVQTFAGCGTAIGHPSRLPC